MASKAKRIARIAAELREKATRLGKEQPVRQNHASRHDVAMADALGWRFILTIEPDHAGRNKVMFSAQLTPPGRSSVPEDWDTVGAMAGALGAPPDALATPFEDTHPNASHYWVWYPDHPNNRLLLLEAHDMQRKALALTRQTLAEVHSSHSRGEKPS